MRPMTTEKKSAGARRTPLLYAGPLNFALTLRRYQAYGEDAANRFDGMTFRKAFRLDGNLYLLSISENNRKLVLEVHPDGNRRAVKDVAENMARKILGLDFDLQAFYEMAEDDAVLTSLIERYYGLRPTLSPDLFEMLITAISAQQINLQFAFTVRSRLTRRYGEPMDYQGTRYFAFPTPDKLARARVQTLRNLQFTQRKAEYIVALSKRISSGEIDLDNLRLASEERIHELLTQSRGIGRWTVDWFLARGLGRGSAFPAGDLGVAKAVQHFYFAGKQQDQKILRDFATRWGDFQNLAVHYLLPGYYLNK